MEVGYSLGIKKDKYIRWGCLRRGVPIFFCLIAYNNTRPSPNEFAQFRHFTGLTTNNESDNKKTNKLCFIDKGV